MKTLCLTIWLLVMQTGWSTENPSDDQQQPSIEAITTANNLLSDEAVLAYLKPLYKYMPEEYDALLNQPPDQLKVSIQNIRDHHSMIGIHITDLLAYFEESPEFQDFLAQIWAEDTLVAPYAESVLENLTQTEYRSILQVGQQLISTHQGQKPINLTEDFPPTLSFLQIKQIRISKADCEIYLYKGIGSMKSIGFQVKQEDKQWHLSHFNYLKSWNHVPIELQSQ